MTNKTSNKDNESRLFELIDLIHKAEIALASKRSEHFKQKDEIKSIEGETEVEVANDKGLKNATARSGLYNKLLEENKVYQELNSSHKKLIHDITIQEAELHKLENEFSVRKLILRKEGKE